MDIIKIGNFIRECRKEKNMTQQQLADKIHVEAKTISKWETGKGLPDVSIMKLLCKELNIEINELFIGERISDDSKKEEIEKLILDTFEREARLNKKNIIGQVLVGISLMISAISTIMVSIFASFPLYVKIIIITIAAICIVIGIIGLIILDINIGYFECSFCRERFIPSAKEYVFGAHTITKRRLTCPKCGKKTFAKKKVSKK